MQDRQREQVGPSQQILTPTHRSLPEGNRKKRKIHRETHRSAKNVEPSANTLNHNSTGTHTNHFSSCAFSSSFFLFMVPRPESEKVRLTFVRRPWPQQANVRATRGTFQPSLVAARFGLRGPAISCETFLKHDISAARTTCNPTGSIWLNAQVCQLQSVNVLFTKKKKFLGRNNWRNSGSPGTSSRPSVAMASPVSDRLPSSRPCRGSETHGTSRPKPQRSVRRKPVRSKREEP